MHFPSFSIRRSFASILLCLFCTLLGYGQYHERALERARSVKMLTDDREAVRRIFHDFNLDDSDETSDEFSFGETQVEVTYSNGNCSDDAEVWEVAAGRVMKIRISDWRDWQVGELKVDISKFEREQRYRGDKSSFIVHSKKEGLAFEVSDDDVEAAIVFLR